MKWFSGHLPVYPGYLDHSGPAGSFVLISYGNRFIYSGSILPNTWWLTTKEIYSFTILEDRSLNSTSQDRNQGVCRGVLPPDALGKSLSCFLQLFPPVTASSPWLFATSLSSSRPASSGLSLLCFHISPLYAANLVCLSLIRTPVLEFRAHTDNPG